MRLLLARLVTASPGVPGLGPLILISLAYFSFLEINPRISLAESCILEA